MAKIKAPKRRVESRPVLGKQKRWKYSFTCSHQDRVPSCPACEQGIHCKECGFYDRIEVEE